MNHLLHDIALTFVEGVGASIGARLVRHFGSAKAVFEQESPNLLAIQGVKKEIVASIKNGKVIEKASSELEKCAKLGIKPLALNQSDYPKKLKNIPDAPLVIYCLGNIDFFYNKSVAVVGTRRITSYGKEITKELVKEIAYLQPVIVSGMAAGVDITAHLTAMEHKLCTFAVLPNGLNKVYPAEHKKYLRQVLNNNGCLISEFPLGTFADTQNFPRRNRIIAGLSDALVITESNIKGGAMFTARLAAQYNRDVFAFPGRINDTWSQGTNFLISNNEAALLLNGADLSTKMGWRQPKSVSEPSQPKLFIDLSDDELKIRDVLVEFGTCNFDFLYEKLNWPTSKLNSTLLTMELNSVIKALPGKVFQLF